jgi:lipopolysaccharide export system protein LptC
VDLNKPLVLLFLTLCALASGYLLLSYSAEDEEEVDGPRLGIGYYMSEAELIGTDDDGEVLYRVSAKSAAQGVDDGIINMEDVRVIYEPRTAIKWDLKATTGRIPANGTIIELAGEVVAVTRDRDIKPTTITTDYLELDTETYIANTRRKVTIDYSSNRVFATGMRAYFKEDRLQLISNVNGKFVP